MSNEWYTPSKYIEAAREVMGSIDLDPASCALANETVQATQYYTKEQDGLTLPWHGNVWLNPPYSHTGKWTERAIEEYKQGNIQQVVITSNASTDTKWFQSLFEYLCCFVRGRIIFFNPEYPPNSPRFPYAFIYLGSYEQKFKNVFSQFGHVVMPERVLV